MCWFSVCLTQPLSRRWKPWTGCNHSRFINWCWHQQSCRFCIKVNFLKLELDQQIVKRCFEATKRYISSNGQCQNKSFYVLKWWSPHLLILLLAILYLRFRERDQKHYQSLEHWCLQNYEQPKFHLRQVWFLLQNLIQSHIHLDLTVHLFWCSPRIDCRASKFKVEYASKFLQVERVKLGFWFEVL
jgi:hypothetical protein